MSTLLTIKIALFVASTAAIAWLSLPSLRHPGSHGFYRFFAWQTIAVLFVLNVDRWFVDPFSAHQIVSWVLLAAGLAAVVEGARLLRLAGHPKDVEGSDEYHFEQTTRLVTVGAYRWIRHPMYSSLLFLAWGIFLKNPSLLGIGLAVVATGFLLATAKADEWEDLGKFGDAYAEYMCTTKRFIPWVW